MAHPVGGAAHDDERLTRFQPSTALPTSPQERLEANLEALRTLKALRESGRRADQTQKEKLGAWSGWGGLSGVFDTRKNPYPAQAQQLREILDEHDYDAARAGVLDQYYTPGELSQAIWQALSVAGVDGGHGIEPGCGAGTFIAHAPQNAHMTGVELDPTTAAIAAHLYPGDEIRNEGYETTPTPRFYDFAVGNVPFGSTRLHDPANNPGNHTIHNHFILKALNQTKPGGYVTMVTSHHTMDAKNPAARREMYERADLAAALRLPAGTFPGTEVVTDVLVFRVRKQGEAAKPFTWEASQPTVLQADDGQQVEVTVNQDFATNAFPTLGTPSVGVGMYGAMGLIVRPEPGQDPSSLAHQVQASLSSQLARAASNGLGYSPQAAPLTIEYMRGVDEKRLGTWRLGGTVNSPEFIQHTERGWEVVSVPASQASQLAALIELRDHTVQLLSLERETRGEHPDLERHRGLLGDEWRRYVETYGPLNARNAVYRSSKDRFGQVQEEVSYRTPAVMRLFNQDPHAALTRAIEVYDENTGKAEPAAILKRRQLFATYTPKGADTPAEALAISQAVKGEVDLDYCAQLLSLPDAQGAREALGTLVFDTPSGSLVAREEYLSGNVRRKLAQAEHALETNPAMAVNIEALTQVMPRDLGVADVVPTIGATWISAADYTRFMSQKLGVNSTVEYAGSAGWRVTGGGSHYYKGMSTNSTEYRNLHQYGSPKLSAAKIMESLLNTKPIRVMMPAPDAGDPGKGKGTMVVDREATEIALGQAEKIQELFSEWIFADPARTSRLLKVYNERFNSLVPRSYEQAGSELQLPGLASTYTLHTHQRSAVARMIAEPTTGLFHEVGAGKTLEMVCGVMEQKRLGLINKPLIVVPNHMLLQFETEWLQAYPQAKLLCRDGVNFGEQARKDFLARATTGEWDAIILTYSSFRSIPVSKETEAAYLEDNMRQFDSWVATQDSQDLNHSVRYIEQRRRSLTRSLQAQMEKLRKSADRSVTFEDLGVDYLVIDEAHEYKNLSQPTHTQGLISQGTPAKVDDLLMKLGYLRKTYGERVATFATATPVANAMGEMWVMTNYLRPDLLREAGVDCFDAWVNTFTAPKSEVEVSTTGKLEVRQRISEFTNVPELTTMWRTFADVKRREELDLKVPQLTTNAAGERSAQVVSVDVGAGMEVFNEHLVRRVEAIRNRTVPLSEDNSLQVINDARSVGSDARLLSPEAFKRSFGGAEPHWSGHKVDAVAANIARIYHATKDRTYSSEEQGSGVSSTPGALQLVFCDRGTPKTGWSMYDAIKDQLVTDGVPEEKIAFVHEAATTVEKNELFARARSGAIAVLIGSTQKMGTGANMQKRAIALHHVDAPWRPCDITQREGRIIRQGNENSEVEIFRYVTQGSFDAYMWQTLERKAAFINMVMKAGSSERTLTGMDLDGEREVIDFGQVKAIATGNPLEVEKARLANQVSALGARVKQWDREHAHLESTLNLLTGQIADYETNRVLAARYMPETLPGAGVSFNPRLYTYSQPTTYQEGRPARDGLRQDLARYVKDQARPSSVDRFLRAEVIYDGVFLNLYQNRSEKTLRDGKIVDQVSFSLRVQDLVAFPLHREQACTFTLEELQDPRTNIVERIRRCVERSRTLPQQYATLLADARRERELVEQRLGETNPWASKFEAAKAQLREVRRELGELIEGQEALPSMSHRDPIIARARQIAEVGMSPQFTSRAKATPTHRPEASLSRAQVMVMAATVPPPRGATAEAAGAAEKKTTGEDEHAMIQPSANAATTSGRGKRL